MKQATLNAIFDHLVNAEALLTGVKNELSKQERDTQNLTPQSDRVGGILRDLSRTRREFEYWFIPPDMRYEGGNLEQEDLPF